MEILLNLKSTVDHILLLDNSCFLIGKNIVIKINIGLNDISISDFNTLLKFASENNEFSQVYSNNLTTYIDGSSSICENNTIIYFNLFFYFIGLKSNSIQNKYFNIGYKLFNSIYVFNKNNKLNSFYYAVSVLGDNVLKIIKEIEVAKQIKIFSQKKIIDNEKNYIRSYIINKKLDIKKDEYVAYSRDCSQVKIIENIQKRLQGTQFQRLFLNKNYINSSKLQIKIKQGILHPVIKILKISKFGNGHLYSSIYNVTDRDGYLNKKNIGISTGFHKNDKNIARAKALAEGVERYNSGFFKSDGSIKKALNELNYELCEKLIGYSIDSKHLETLHYYKHIYKLKSNGDDIIRGYNGLKIPSNIVYYPYWNKNKFYNGNSSGIAAGRTYEEAMWNGIMELSERDSILVTWIHKITPDLIDINSLSKSILLRINNIFSKGELYVFDVSYGKLLPHILVVYKTKDHKIFVGASAGIDLSTVINKALDEIEVSLFYNAGNVKVILDYKEVNSISAHNDYYSNKTNIKYLNFLFRNNNIVSYNQLNNEYNNKLSIGNAFYLLKKSVGGNFYIADLTTVYSYNIGIYVVKILSENLIPIWFRYNSKLPHLKERFYNKELFMNYKKTFYRYNVPDFLHFFN